MSRRIASSRGARLFALPLALWAAVPGVQWCRVGWADVRLECFAECSIEPGDCSANPCAAGGRGAGEPAAEGCPAGVPECALGPCGSDAGAEGGLPGGRAYCLSGPAGGDAIPSAPVEAAPPLAVLTAAGWDDTIAGRPGRPPEPAVGRPPGPEAWAVPRIRAPPSPGSTTG